MARIGFLVNPIAGMGGRVGLKGTDGVVAEAARLGAEPVANVRALAALRHFAELLKAAQAARDPPAIRWLTASGAMGGDALAAAGFTEIDIVHDAPANPSAQDTIAAVGKFLAAGIDLVLFCGGDGTARDICGVTGDATPVLGIPAGVKMYSGVFALTPAHAAEVLMRHLRHEIGLAEVEILDLDEEKYRRNEWAVRLYMAARTPFEPAYVQAAKVLVSGPDEDAAKAPRPVAPRPGRAGASHWRGGRSHLMTNDKVSAIVARATVTDATNFAGRGYDTHSYFIASKLYYHLPSKGSTQAARKFRSSVSGEMQEPLSAASVVCRVAA